MGTKCILSNTVYMSPRNRRFKKLDQNSNYLANILGSLRPIIDWPTVPPASITSFSMNNPGILGEYPRMGIFH